jgi:hypothetical protein
MNNAEDKLDAILERTIITEQRLISIEARLEDSKNERQMLKAEFAEIKETFLKTKTITGAVVFVFSCLFTLMLAFKDQVLHLFGIK